MQHWQQAPVTSSLNSQFDDGVGFVSQSPMSHEAIYADPHTNHGTDYIGGGEVQYVWAAVPNYETASSGYPSHMFAEPRSNVITHETREHFMNSQALDTHQKHQYVSSETQFSHLSEASLNFLDPSQSFVHPSTISSTQTRPATSSTNAPLRIPSGVPHVTFNAATSHLQRSSSVPTEDHVSNCVPERNPSSASNSIQQPASGNKPLIQAVYDTKNGTIRFIRTGNTSRLGPQYLPVMRQNGMLRATNGVYFVPAYPVGMQASGKPKVKRPQNSFLVFSNVFRPKLRAEHKDMSNAEVSKLLGEKWKLLSASEKQKYVEQAHRIKQEFNAMHPDYVYTKTPRRNKKRKPSALDGKKNDTEDEECDKSDEETDDVLLSEDVPKPAPPSAAPAAVDWWESSSSGPDLSFDSTAAAEFPFKLFRENPYAPSEVDSTCGSSTLSVQPGLAKVTKLTNYTSAGQRQADMQIKEPGVVMPQDMRTASKDGHKPSVQLFVNPRFSSSSLPPFLRPSAPNLEAPEVPCSIKPVDFANSKAQHGAMRFEVNSNLKMPPSRVTVYDDSLRPVQQLGQF